MRLCIRRCPDLNNGGRSSNLLPHLATKVLHTLWAFLLTPCAIACLVVVIIAPPPSPSPPPSPHPAIHPAFLLPLLGLVPGQVWQPPVGMSCTLTWRTFQPCPTVSPPRTLGSWAEVHHTHLVGAKRTGVVVASATCSLCLLLFVRPIHFMCLWMVVDVPAYPFFRYGRWARALWGWERWSW